MTPDPLGHGHKTARCPTCGLVFTTYPGFDAHRVGPIGPRRRCLTPPEMLAAGFRHLDNGRWTPYPEREEP